MNILLNPKEGPLSAPTMGIHGKMLECRTSNEVCGPFVAVCMKHVDVARAGPPSLVFPGLLRATKATMKSSRPELAQPVACKNMILADREGSKRDPVRVALNSDDEFRKQSTINFTLKARGLGGQRTPAT